MASNKREKLAPNSGQLHPGPTVRSAIAGATKGEVGGRATVNAHWHALCRNTHCAGYLSPNGQLLQGMMIKLGVVSPEES